MSFSGKVKEELSTQINSARHCRIAELSAIISMRGEVSISQNDEYILSVHTENELVAVKTSLLLKKIFGIDVQVKTGKNSHAGKDRIYIVELNNHKDSIKVLQAAKLINSQGEIGEDLAVSDNIIIQQVCCKRAFLRGAFLAAGYVNNPENAYHMEIVCDTKMKSEKICKIMKNFEIDAKVVARKKCYVVYIKEGEGIVNALNVMEAHVSLMEFENIRILKDMRNSLNRRNNCDVANINKVVQTGVKQKEDIEFIRDTIGYGSLPENLRDIAIIRLENPDASLKELGEMLTPPIGKSGVNHRLRKISSIAESLRDGKEEF
ncbi:MAG: DNA-binding protein WhiA [Eubacterium sp.]